MNYLMVLFGGAIGSLCRYRMSILIMGMTSGFLPYGTLFVNTLGSFIIGMTFELSQYLIISPNMKIFITIGFLGGVTTFSSYTVETVNLFREGEYFYGILNILANNILGLFFLYLGVIMIKYIFQIIK